MLNSNTHRTMRLLTPLLALALAAHAQAQPTLTFAGNAPQPGTTFTQRYGPYQDPGPAGPNAVWDFSALSVDSTTTLQYVAPSATPHAAQFPNATVAQVGGGNTFYYQATATGVQLVGNVSDGLVIPYSDPGMYLPFPCTYQTSWSDTEAASFVADGTPVTRTGTATGEADGHGTLVMPDGSIVGDVLRVHWTDSVTDATPVFSFDIVYDSHLYYVNGLDRPLLQVVESTLSFNGFTETVQFTQWTDGLATGMFDKVHDGPLQVYPNPATDQLTLRDVTGGYTVAHLFDATGRLVRSQGLAAGRAVMEVGDLPPGLYIVEFRDAGQRRHAERVQVQ
jgi:hypothetical protein